MAASASASAAASPTSVVRVLDVGTALEEDEVFAAMPAEDGAAERSLVSVGTDEEEIRAESRSRLSRFKSARTSAALW